MIYDLLDIYRKNSRGDTMALDSYNLPNGLYIRVHMDEKEADELLVDKDTPANGELYSWFKSAEFYSRLIEMNKPVDPKKKIHSNNMYSIFVKHSTLISERKLSPIFKESVIRYYDTLANLKKEHKQLLDAFDLPDINMDILQKNKEKILLLTGWLVEKVLSYNFKSDIYIKVFLNADIGEYRREGMRYFIPRIFNNNDYNIIVDGILYGLSNNNMGLNSKKPYLEHKTTNYKVPFRISITDALDSKNLMEWLENQKKDGKPVLTGYLPVGSESQFSFSDDISSEINGHYIHLEKGIKTIIDDYDFLPGVTDKIKPFRLENYLRLNDFNTEVITSRSVLEKRVDEWLYNKNLISNYYNAQPKPKTGFTIRQVNLLILSKTAMLNFFRKCDDTSLRRCIDKVSLGLIKEAVLNNTYGIIEKTDIASAMNLRLSMLKYFKIGGKEDMGDIIKPLWQILKKKIIDSQPNEDQICDSDIEFFFAAGQLTRYLVSLSQAQKINYNIIDPILNARDARKIKTEIHGLIKKYSHAIDTKAKRINLLIALVMGYDPDEPSTVIHDAFMAGFASKNIIYYKEDDEK